ncbi:MAG: hypothetical protein Q8K99_04685 [Actinomycetota bacterium]|nr:hypothetical protein [Actinomycetota bacterium]
MVERDQVALFLELLRQCASCSFRFERRPENMATLARLGITIPDARARVLALTPADYVEGPTARPENPSQEAWVFGLNVRGAQVYVKVSIRLEPARCLCISFHDAKWPLAFPYRSEQRRVDR